MGSVVRISVSFFRLRYGFVDAETFEGSFLIDGQSLALLEKLSSFGVTIVEVGNKRVGHSPEICLR